MLPVVVSGTDVTPMLLPVANLFASVMPPLTSTCLLSLTAPTVPMSPPNLRPSSIVATSRTMFLLSAPLIGSPLASFGTYTIRSALSVSPL